MRIFEYKNMRVMWVNVSKMSNVYKQCQYVSNIAMWVCANTSYVLYNKYIY